MSDTLSTYLRLRLSDALTPSARYNLLRIDNAFSRLSTALSGDTTLRSAANIAIEPNSADISGSGTGGTVNIGTSGHSLTAINLYGPTALTGTLETSEDATIGGQLFVDGAEINLLDSASGGTGYLVFRYNSAASGSVDPTSRQFTIDPQAGNRSLIMSGDLTLGGNLTTAAAVMFSGAHAFTATLTGTTGVTFPTSGTLLALSTTASTVGAAGGASALPATPTGYVVVNISGTDRKIPYYAT